MLTEAFKKTPKKWSIFGAHLGPLWAPKMASFWLYFSVYFGPRFLVTFTAHFVKIDIKSERFLEPKMSSKWSRRVAPKPPINRLKIKLLFASVFGCLGEASKAGPDPHFRRPSRWKWRFYVGSLGCLLERFWSQNGVQMGTKMGCKCDQKSRAKIDGKIKPKWCHFEYPKGTQISSKKFP